MGESGLRGALSRVWLPLVHLARRCRLARTCGTHSLQGGASGPRRQTTPPGSGLVRRSVRVPCHRQPAHLGRATGRLFGRSHRRACPLRWRPARQGSTLRACADPGCPLVTRECSQRLEACSRSRDRGRNRIGPPRTRETDGPRCCPHQRPRRPSPRVRHPPVLEIEVLHGANAAAQPTSPTRTRPESGARSTARMSSGAPRRYLTPHLYVSLGTRSLGKKTIRVLSEGRETLS